MKVFLSWSGHKSHCVALALRDWLPSVIQSVTPYVSSEDIDKGARWSTDIAKELEDCSFGILCVTKENLEAPWLLFEAGALSKMMQKGAVCPFLFDLKMAEIKEGPILQFQTTVFEKEDIKKLLISLNKACGEVGLKEDLLFKSFEVWWPTLETSLKDILSEKEEKTIEKRPNDKEGMLEEILELARINQKILRSPEILLPIEYMDSILHLREKINSPREKRLFEELNMNLLEIRQLSRQLTEMIEHGIIEEYPMKDNIRMMLFRLNDIVSRMRLLMDSSLH